MRIRKFEGTTIQQAMAKVKNELGKDAVILHTRELPKRFFGLFGHSGFEVTAAIDEQESRFTRQPAVSPRATAQSYASPKPSAVSSPAAPTFDSVKAAQDFLSRMEQLRESNHSPSVDVTVDDDTTSDGNLSGHQKSHNEADDNRLEALEVRIDRLANTMERLLTMGGPFGELGVLADLPTAWHGAMRRLFESNLSEELLRDLAKQLTRIPHPGQELESGILQGILASYLKTTPPISKPKTGQRIVALVGPTGVGKTTTLAKLASGLTLDANVHTKVGLITVDTYRLAAEDQLRKYADIMQLEVKVVYSPEEMEDALAQLSGSDVVFVDTAGRCPRDEGQMNDLLGFLRQIPNCEVSLVLSSTMNERYLQETVERFRPLGIHNLIVTKLDETQNYAIPLNLYHVTRLPLAYITTGQNVPEDIEIAEEKQLATRVMHDLMDQPDETPSDQQPTLAAVVNG